MNDVAIGIVTVFLLMGVFLTGIELAFAMALVGFLGYTYLTTFSAACNLLAKDFFDTFTAYTLTVIPLFVLMGQIAYYSGIAKRLYGAADKLIGRVPGGLAMTTVVGATLFKAMCGSTLATAATFASLAVPEMQRHGYSRKLSTGVVSSVGTLGVIFPPSITLIIFGIISEQSIGRLFLAGIVPGLIISFFFMVVIYGWVKIDPSIAPKADQYSWKQKVRSIPELLWVAMIFLIVMGGLMKGLFTPTEAGTIGTLCVLLLALTKEHLPFKKLITATDESVRSGCMVLTLLAGSSLFGHFLAITEIPAITAEWTAGLPFPKVLIMISIMLIYLIGGSFIDDVAFMIMATPIFFPVVIKLGYDPIWFGIIIGITVMIGGIIPPVAMCVFVVKNITGDDFNTIYAGVCPFLLSLIACAILLFIFPQITSFLPNMFAE